MVELIRDDHAESSLDERQKLALRFSDAFLGDPAALDPALRSKMLEHFSPAQIVELSAGLALFMGFSKLAIALGQAPDSMPILLMPTPDIPGSD